MGDETRKYKKIPGFATMEGQNFEIKLSALLFLRGLNSGREFQLATNVEGVGALDDVVFQFRTPDNIWQTCFIQLKHKKSSQLRKDMLLGSKGDFALPKYFNSFLDIRQLLTREGNSELFKGNFDACHFAIFTNAPVHPGKWGLETRDIRSPMDDYLKMGGDKVQANLTEHLVESIYNDLKQAEEDLKDFPNNRHEVLNRPISLNEKDAKDFLTRLKLFAGQPSEDQLDDIIKLELVEACKKTCVNIDSLFQKYKEAVENWWKNSEGISLNQNSCILQRALYEAQFDAIIPQQKEKFRLDIRFQETSLESLKKACAQQHSLLHVVADESIRTTATKLLQVLESQTDSYIFLGTECLQKERDAVVSAWCHGKKHLLVVISEATSDNPMESDISADLSRVLLENEEKRIVLVSPRNGTFSNQLKVQMGTNITVFKDCFNLSQLDKESISSILDKEVIFQGKATLLGSLFDRDIDVMSQVLKGVLGTVIANKTWSVGNELKEDISYYVPRTMEKKNIIKYQIFADRKFSGKIKVHGATLTDVDVFVQNEQQRIREKFRETNEGLIFDAYEDSANKEALHSRKDVHYLDFLDSKLIWKKSEGDINFIKRHVDGTVTEETEYSDHRLVLLVAEPGMGKSTSLTHLAQHVKQVRSDFWVVSITLNDHTTLFANTKEADLNAETFLGSALGIENMSELDQVLFKFCLNQSGNMAVLLDGFDEIAPKYATKCCALLTSIVRSKVKLIKVSSRYSMKDILESHLQILAGTLRKFSEQDQRGFFVMYWGKSSRLSPQELDLFISKLLQITSQSINDKEKEFTGIPLQTHMLAEVFEEYVTNKVSALPERLNVLELIEQFVERKLVVYLKRKHNVNRDSTEFEDILEEQREIFAEKHIMAALLLLFGDTNLKMLHSVSFKKKVDKFFSSIKSGVDKTGIVDKIIDGKPAFLHRVFAEYFAALWFAENFADCQEFMSNNLLEDTFGVVRNMFDRILSKENKLQNAVLNGDILEVDSLLKSGADVNETDKGGRTALHLAVTASLNTQTESEKNIAMVELLLAGKASLDIVDDVLNWAPARYVDATGLWAEMDVLLKYGNKIAHFEKTKNNLYSRDMIEKVFKNDFSHVFAMLLELKLPVDSKSEHYYSAYNDSGVSTLLHTCAVYGSFHISQVLTMGKTKKTLSQNGHLHETVKQLQFQQDGWGNTPLMTASFYGKLQVIRTILDTFKDDPGEAQYVNCLNNEGQSAVLLASIGGHHEVLKILITSGADVTARDKSNDTALINASNLGHVHFVEVLLESLITNLDARTKFVNLVNDGGRSALTEATYWLRTDIVDLLILAGAQPHRIAPTESGTGKTALWSASERGDISAVRELLGQFTDEQERSDFVNARYKWRQTSLFKAGELGRLTVVKLLIEAGADVTARDQSGQTALIKSACSGHLYVVKTMLESFTSEAERVQHVNVRDDRGRSALWWATEKGHVEVINLLVKMGAVVFQ